MGAAQKIDLVSTSTDDLKDIKTKAELLKDVQSTLAQSLTNVVKDAAGNVLIGGSARVAFATSRQVQLQEDFERPLAIGYLGFDVEILEDGRLGPQVSTFYQLQDPTPILCASQDLPPSVAIWSRLALKSVHMSLNGLKQDVQDGNTPAGFSNEHLERFQRLCTELDALATYLPRHHPMRIYHRTSNIDDLMVRATFDEAGDPVPRKSFHSVISYWDAVDASRCVLERAIDSGQGLQITDDDGNTATIGTKDLRWLLAETEDELQKLQASLNAGPVIPEAVNFWYHHILTGD